VSLKNASSAWAWAEAPGVTGVSAGEDQRAELPVGDG